MFTPSPKKPAKVYSRKHPKMSRREKVPSKSTYLSLSLKHKHAQDSSSSSDSDMSNSVFIKSGNVAEMCTGRNDFRSTHATSESLSVGDSKESYYVLKNKDGGAYTVERISGDSSSSGSDSIELMRDADQHKEYNLKSLKEDLLELQDVTSYDGTKYRKPLNSTLLSTSHGRNINDLTAVPDLSAISEFDGVLETVVKPITADTPLSTTKPCPEEMMQIQNLDAIPDIVVEFEEEEKNEDEARLEKTPTGYNTQSFICTTPKMKRIRPRAPEPTYEIPLEKTPISQSTQSFECTTPQKMTKFSSIRPGILEPKTSTFISGAAKSHLDYIPGISAIQIQDDVPKQSPVKQDELLTTEPSKFRPRCLTSTPVKDIENPMASICDEVSTVVQSEDSNELQLKISRFVNSQEIVAESLNVSDPFDDQGAVAKDESKNGSFSQMFESSTNKSKQGSNSGSPKKYILPQNIPQCCIETFPDDVVKTASQTKTHTQLTTVQIPPCPDDILCMEL